MVVGVPVALPLGAQAAHTSATDGHTDTESAVDKQGQTAHNLSLICLQGKRRSGMWLIRRS